MKEIPGLKKLRKDYWSNGKLWSKGNYKNGKREGYWAEYDRDGKIRYKGYYKDGELIEEK